METFKAIKRKVRLFWSKEQKKKDILTGLTLIFLAGIFVYSFFYTHYPDLGNNGVVRLSTFNKEQELTGFAEREVIKKTTAASEGDINTSGSEEIASSEPTSKTITRQTDTTASSSATRTVSRTSAASRTLSSAISRTPSAPADSSLSRIVSPTRVERKTAITATGERTLTRASAKPAVIRTVATPLQSFESVKTETVQRKSAIVVQRTAPSLTKGPVTISRKPVTDLGEETVQKIEEEVKKIEENPELPAVKQVLEKSLEEKKVTLVLATNPGAQTVAPKLSVTINKKPTEEYKPRLNQPWNPLGLFNAMLYGRKTVNSQSFSTGNDPSLIAQQMDISSLGKGKYEVFTQLTDEGKVLAVDRTDFSNEGKE